jgi:cell division protein FtsN
MSRDYKPKEESAQNGNPFLTGMMIGFLLGVVASLAVIMIIKGNDSPFAVQSVETNTKLAEKIKEDAAKASKTVKLNLPSENGKSRFDFYTILPGTESKVSIEEEQKLVEQLPTPEPDTSTNYYLQVSAFQSEEEADNLKAKLALQGFEAVVQSAAIPDKGIWHRVRVGPLSSLDQINRTKANLLDNGFKADLIKTK